MIITSQNNDDIYTVSNKSKMFSAALGSNNIYHIYLNFPTSISYVNKLPGIIDTGASNTAISIKALYRMIDETKYNILINASKQTKAHTKQFSSVKGKNDTTGILCQIPEVKINGYVIKDFPFYLIDDLERTIALIGSDFISSCDVMLLKNKEMNFYNFDINSMWNKMESKNALDLLNLQ